MEFTDTIHAAVNAGRTLSDCAWAAIHFVHAFDVDNFSFTFEDTTIEVSRESTYQTIIDDYASMQEA
jgi:hypothetical protein